MSIMEGYIFGEHADNEHYNIDEIVAIENDMKQDKARIEDEYLAKVQGTFVLEEAIPATEDSDEVPATYYKLTTKANLIKEMTSDYFDVEMICSEYEDNYGEYKKGRSFTEFKKLATK